MDDSKQQNKHRTFCANDQSTFFQELKSKTEEILEILQHRIDPKYIDKNGDTVLHAVLGNEKLVEKDVIRFLTYFLTEGVKPNIRNHREKNVLQLAVERRMKNVVDLLLQFGADIHSADKNGNSIAHFFIEDEFEKRKLAMLYPIMNTPENLEVTQNCSVNFLKFLISKNVDFECTNNQGKSAMNLAHLPQYLDYLPHIVSTLLEHIDAKSNENTLHLSVKRSSTMINVPAMAYANYGSEIISDAIKEKKNMTIIKTHVNYYLDQCDDRNFATTLYRELMSTCQLWDNQQTDYFLTVLRQLLAFGVNVNNQLSYKNLVLNAMKARNFLLLEFLKENGVNFNFKSRYGQSLLHLLAEQREYDESSSEFYSNFCDQLLSGNFDVNARDDQGNSALHTAAGYGNIPMVGVLIERDAEVNCKNHNMMTPFHGAVMMNQSVELMELLITNGAEVNVTDRIGDSPLRMAVSNNNLAAVRSLIEHGASNFYYDNNRRTLLYAAVMNNKAPEIIEILLEKGADINSTVYKGETLLNHAISQDNVPVVRLLVKHSEAVNFKDESQRTPLHRAVMLNKSLEIIELLLKAGSDVNSKDNEGNWPIHEVFNQLRLFNNLYLNRQELLVLEKARVMLKMLLNKGAYVNAENGRGETPLFIALSIKSCDMVAELLKYNVDLHDSKVQQLLYQATYPLDLVNLVFLPVISLHTTLKLFLRKYWLKLKLANLPFDEKYQDSIKENVGQNYDSECLREIEKLKSTIIDGSMSFFDYIHMRPKLRSVYINHENFQQFVELMSIEKEFPLYSDVILTSYLQDKLFKKRKQISSALAEVFEVYDASVHHIADKVADYLDDEDVHLICKF